MALDTEEEQVEKIQKIWETYKRLIIAGIVVFLGLYFTYNFYVNQSIKNLEKASQLYQEIIISKPTSLEKISEKVTSLKNIASNTPYASRSAIYLSKIYSQNSNNEAAIEELIWAQKNATEDSIESLASYLLANLYLVSGKLDEALVAANKIDSIGFQALAKDIIGDIHLELGDKIQAKKSYIESLELNKGQGDIRKILQNKIDSIGQ
jgi:predicted negative regulator of RcsB-dependent stress response